MNRAEQAEVLRVGRHHLIVRPEPQPGDHDPAALRGRGHQRHTLGVDPDFRGQRGS
jgi:hypothetical protein